MERLQCCLRDERFLCAIKVDQRYPSAEVGYVLKGSGETKRIRELPKVLLPVLVIQQKHVPMRLVCQFRQCRHQSRIRDVDVEVKNRERIFGRMPVWNPEQQEPQWAKLIPRHTVIETQSKLFDSRQTPQQGIRN